MSKISYYERYWLDLTNTNDIMTIQDLTKEQAIEIAKLIHAQNEIESISEMEWEFKYQRFSPRTHENSEGDDELIHLYFKANIFGNTIDRIRLTIYANLDCHWGYLRNGEYSLPTNNQCAIQKKFIEWGIEPTNSLS